MRVTAPRHRLHRPTGPWFLTLVLGAGLLTAAVTPGPRQAEPATVDAAAVAVDASTIDHKFLLGYQGWFQCPTDGSPGAAWRHWFAAATGPSLTTGVQFDAWPDTRQLTAAEKCDTGLTLPDGSPAYLFSDYNPQTVLRQFQWMRAQNLDGVMLQRFTSELASKNMFPERNQVARNVMAAAAQTGRAFAITYDISGQDPATLVSTIENDWAYLVDTLGATRSHRYLRQAGRPVVELWGFGFPDRPGAPADLQALLDFFHDNPDPAYRAYVVGGVDNDWRTNPSWAQTLTGFDAISPWMVGRITGLTSADDYRATTAAELSYATVHQQFYLPVIFPGFSFHNAGGGPLNQIPRLGGNFLWRQAYNDLSVGATALFGAMFDEVNEGTALFKMAPTKASWPAGMQLVPVRADGYTKLPSDWYLQVAGQVAGMVHGMIPLMATMPITPQ